MNNLWKNVLLTPFNLLYAFSPETDLKLLFRLKQGRKLRLDAPVTYNEKLQWIKLYDRREEMTVCCDKYAVRDYVKARGCGEILNELYWVGERAKDIPFDRLPQQFVIKVTHGSTFNMICKDKEKLDRKRSIRLLQKWMKARFLPCYGEWFYGVVKPHIIVEKYLDGGGDDLIDYKVFCFEGKARYIRVDKGRFSAHMTKSVYDTGWNLRPEAGMGKPVEKTPEPRPQLLEQMLEYAEKLAEGFHHARIDFYLVEGSIYFGEITFTNGAGFDPITPPEFDEEMGQWIKLPVRS